MALNVPLDRVGIVMLSAIGDAVHVLPVVNALRRHRADIRITWVLQPGPAALVRGHPSIDEIITFDRRRGWRAFADARAELRRRRFDVVLALQSYFKAGVLTSFARAPAKLGYDRGRSKDLTWLFTNHHLPPGATCHVQDEYLEFVEQLGVASRPVEWKLSLRQDEREAHRPLLERLDRPYAALVVGSSKPAKDWPADRWAAVASHLHSEFGIQPILVGGRSTTELAAEREILERTRGRVVSMLGSGLRPLIGILEGASLVISLDTGPLHIATALGRPVISLIGYTDPRRTGPYRHCEDLVIDGFHDPAEIAAIEPSATMPDEIIVPISRDTRHGRMERITVRDVLDRLVRWRSRYAEGGRAESRPNR